MIHNTTQHSKQFGVTASSVGVSIEIPSRSDMRDTGRVEVIMKPDKIKQKDQYPKIKGLTGL